MTDPYEFFLTLHWPFATAVRNLRTARPFGISNGDRVMKRFLLVLILLGAGAPFPLSASGAELSAYDVWIGDNVPIDLWPPGWEGVVDPGDYNYARVTISEGCV